MHAGSLFSLLVLIWSSSDCTLCQLLVEVGHLWSWRWMPKRDRNGWWVESSAKWLFLEFEYQVRHGRQNPANRSIVCFKLYHDDNQTALPLTGLLILIAFLYHIRIHLLWWPLPLTLICNKWLALPYLSQKSTSVWTLRFSPPSSASRCLLHFW